MTKHLTTHFARTFGGLGLLGFAAVLLVAPSLVAQELPPQTLPAPELANPQLVEQELAASDADAPTVQHDFRWAGEELYFSVRLNGVEAIRTAVRSGDVRYKDGHPYVAVSGTAQSSGLFHNIYPLNDRAHTYLNPESLRPLRSEKFFDENGSQRSYHVDFVHSTYQAKVVKTRNEKKRRKFTKPIPGTTHDMFTWFYELRNKRELALGEKMSFYVYDGWKLYRLDATVAKHEDVYTPLGWFKTYRIDFERETLKTKRNKGASPILTVSNPAEPSGSLWISRDENLIPVKVAVNTPWGLGEVILMKYKLPSRYRDE